MNDINLEVKRDKVSGILFIGFILLIISVAVVVLSIRDKNYFIIVFGVAGIFLFGKEVIYIITNLKGTDKWILFSLTNDGINDLSLSVSPGKISWDLISKIEVRRTFGTDFLAVNLVNWKEFSRKLSISKRLVLYINVLLRYAPVNIAINRLDMDAVEILEIINSYRCKLEMQ